MTSLHFSANPISRITQEKPRGGFRQYPLESVKRVHFIKLAQNLGLTLEEVHGLLDLDERVVCGESAPWLHTS